jgi:hypothetical protein
MGRYFFILAAILFALIINNCLAADMAYQHAITAGPITFEWTIVEENIHIKLTAKTTGWVGIGFNPTHEMKDANFIIGYVKDGVVAVKDQFGINENNHAEDVKSGGKENITDISGKEVAGVTEIVFTIPLNTGDKYDGVINPAQDTTILLAYAAGMDSFFTKHKYRTRLKVNLASGSYKEIE